MKSPAKIPKINVPNIFFPFFRELGAVDTTEGKWGSATGTPLEMAKKLENREVVEVWEGPTPGSKKEGKRHNYQGTYLQGS